MSTGLQPLRLTLRCSFLRFLDLVEPGLREEQGLEEVSFLDEQALPGWPAIDRRRLGLVAEVQSADRRRATLLVQIEKRIRSRASLERRLLRGYLQLLVARRQPVRLIVICREGGSPGIRTAAIVETHRGIERLRVPYTTLALAGRPLEDYLLVEPALDSDMRVSYQY